MSAPISTVLAVWASSGMKKLPTNAAADRASNRIANRAKARVPRCRAGQIATIAPATI
jgi:hypothetical protein